jgi:hypothetical protein
MFALIWTCPVFWFELAASCDDSFEDVAMYTLVCIMIMIGGIWTLVSAFDPMWNSATPTTRRLRVVSGVLFILLGLSLLVS